MTQPDPIQLDLDPSGYVQGLGRADQATDSFAGTMRATVNAMTPVQRAMSLITPGRAVLAGFTGLAAVAGEVQQEMLGLSAAAKVTHANVDVLAGGMRRLARDIPIGNTGARELVTQLTRLGVATQGSERNVGSLAKTFANLGGATGEGPAALAAGFVQLNRSMSTGFNPGRMEKLADSLTTVSAQSGASATGILSFAKAIAPMAQASGIGETKVLGISAAFSKLGDDGVGAASAFNKMVGDMNRSVREGSPDMAAYASIVGKTTAQFQNLFKANPAEAITQVTEAIARSGPQGQHQLEQLGLDGVRTQRYLQELATSGGLRASIGQAQAGYGSGNTQKAAAEAFSGLANSGTKLRAVTEQLVDAMGTPLLGAMTTFTDLLRHGAAPVASFVGSRPIQDLIKVAVAAAIPLLVASKLIGTGGTAATGIQALTSGPARGLLAGFMRGMRGDTYEGGRFTRDFLGRVDNNEALATSQGMNAMNQRVFANARSVGDLFGRGSGTGPGMASMLRNTAGAGVGAMLRMQAEQMRLARTGYSERSLRMAPYGAPYRDFSAHRNDINTALAGGHIEPEEAAALRQANRARLLETAGGQGRGATARQLAMGLGAVGYETGRFGLGLGGRALGMVGSQLGVVGGLTAGYELYSHMRSNRAGQVEAASANTGFIDDYRVAMGKATDATQTFAGRMQATADSMVAAVTDMDKALKIDPERIRAATLVQHPVERFAGSPESVAAQLRLQRTSSGITPDVMARISLDLINQFGKKSAQGILDQVGSGPSSTNEDITSAVQGLAQDRGRQGPMGWLARNFNPKYLMPGQTRNSSGFGFSTLSGDQEKGANTIATSLQAQQAKDQDLGADYANKKLTERMNTAVQAAINSGNSDLVNQVITSFQTTFDKGGFGGRISVKDIQQAGSFTAAEGRLSPKFAEATAYSGGGLPDLKDSPLLAQARGTGGEALFGHATAGPDMFGGARASLTKYMTEGTASPSAQTNAVNDAIRAYTASGQSLEHVGMVATSLVAHIEDATGAASQFAVALQQAAMLAITQRPAVVSQGSMAATMASQYAQQAGIAPTNEANKALRAQGVAGLGNVQDQVKGALVARLTAQREFQVSSVRAQEDFGQQMQYGQADYQRSMLRNQHDFDLQRFRSLRDFTKSALHAEQDFQRQRRYAIEDGARAAYSAYQRIAVQQTWDAPNLIGNIQEQAQALQSQLENLATLRHAGGTSTLIKLLDLNNPANAQQLASLVGDMANNPSVLQALNAAAGKRQGLGEKLVGDPDNTALARQDKEFGISMARAREQFGTTMADMAQSQRTAVTRAAEDRNIAVGRMTDANAKMIKRAGEDLARADQEIVGDLTKLSDALNSALKGNFVDFSKMSESSMSKWRELAGKFSGDWKDLVAGLGVSATVTVTATAGDGTPLAQTPLGVANDNTEMNRFRGQLTGGPVSGPVAPAPQAVNKPRKMQMHAMGGLFTHATHMSQYDTAGEAGPEALIPLDKNGAKMLYDIFGTVLRKGDPIGGGALGPYLKDQPVHTEWLTQEHSRMMSTANAATHVHYDSSTHYDDYSQTFENVTVVSQDPDEMGRKLRAHQRRNNLTAAPQTR